MMKGRSSLRDMIDSENSASSQPVECAPALSPTTSQANCCSRSAHSLTEGLDEDSLKGWWRHIQQFPLLTHEREIELAKRIEAGDEAAFYEMIECNLRLVANIARKCRRFAGPSLQLSDLIQEGSLGLMRGVQKFDYRKGYKFSTYASYWIRQAVMRSIAEQGRSVRLPVHAVEALSRADRARVALTQELQRPPSNFELATHLQMRESKVQEITERASEPMSLDMGIGDEDDSVLMDFIEDFKAPSPADAAARAALREEIYRAMKMLPKREAEVISMRFGLDGSGQSRTLDEVGAVMQLTRERIRQLEKCAFKRLKHCGPLQETVQYHSSRSHFGHTSAIA